MIGLLAMWRSADPWCDGRVELDTTGKENGEERRGIREKEEALDWEILLALPG